MIAHAEVSVLGGIMIDPQAYWRVADLLTADDFEAGEHRSIFEAIATLRRAQREADPVTLAEHMPHMAESILRISNSAYSVANIRGYAEIVAAKSTARRVRTAGQRIAKLADADAMGEAGRILASCQPRAVSAVRSLASFLNDSVRTMQERCDAQEILTGVPTSLDWLDEQTSGWQRGDLVIIAARPSVGKTALALQCALTAATAGHPVFFASLEQSGSQIAERSLANLARVSLQHITQPKRIEEHEWPRITNAGTVIKNLPIQIDETGALTVDAICARARQCNATKRLGLIVIDYLTQIMPPRAEKTVDAIQTITRAIKALAKELAVPVILLSQLNREGEDRPVLKNLRDSGAIEQDADVVAFLHRPDSNRRDLVELIIAKQRNGPCDSTYLHADMEHMRFEPTQDRPAPKPTPHRGFGTFASRSAVG